MVGVKNALSFVTIVPDKICPFAHIFVKHGVFFVLANTKVFLYIQKLRHVYATRAKVYPESGAKHSDLGIIYQQIFAFSSLNRNFILSLHPNNRN